jgi:hypothetical protein
MDDITIIEDQVHGLRQRIDGLKATEKLFLQASGLETQAAEARQQGEGHRVRVDGIKKELDELLVQQGELTQAAIGGFLARMNSALPEGSAYIEIGEKACAIGWEVGGVKRPLHALSGGERVAFDAALSYALGADILVKEVAELDSSRLAAVMGKYLELAPQVILVTCHAPATIPAGWTAWRTE